MEIFKDIRIPVYLDYKHYPDKFIDGVNGISREDINSISKLDKFNKFFNHHATTETEWCGIFFNRMLNTTSESEFFRDRREGEPFYYPINMTSMIERHITELSEYIRIPEYILNEIQTNQCKILIYSTWESPTRNSIMRLVESIIKKYPLIQKNNFVVLTNNLELLYPNETDTVYDNNTDLYRTSDIDGVRCIVHHIFMTVGTGNWQEISYDSIRFEHMLHQSIELIKNNVPRKHKFVCLNRRPRPSRWMTALYLYPDRHKGLLSFTLDPGNTSIADFQNFDKLKIDDFRSSISEMLKSPDSNDIKNSMNDFIAWIDYYKLIMPNSNDIRRMVLDDIFMEVYSRLHHSDFVDDLPLLIDDQIDPRSNPVADMAFDKFFNSYLHIVTETETGGGGGGFSEVFRSELKYWFTEKIFKPIWFMQPFVIVGFPGALAHLKNLGFKTFSKYINESYDTEPENHRRVIMALDSAKQFYNRSHEEILVDYNDMIDILQHNRNLLLDYATQLNYNVMTDVMHGLADCNWRN